MTTLPWSRRVGQVWQDGDGQRVTVTAEHAHAGLVQVEHGTGLREWVKGFDERYRPVRCEGCGTVTRREP